MPSEKLLRAKVINTIYDGYKVELDASRYPKAKSAIASAKKLLSDNELFELCCKYDKSGQKDGDFVRVLSFISDLTYILLEAYEQHNPPSDPYDIDSFPMRLQHAIIIPLAIQHLVESINADEALDSAIYAFALGVTASRMGLGDASNESIRRSERGREAIKKVNRARKTKTDEPIWEMVWRYDEQGLSRAEIQKRIVDQLARRNPSAKRDTIRRRVVRSIARHPIFSNQDIR